MKIVQFSNGKYGVRTYWFFGWRYLDLIEQDYSWPKNDEFFRDCIVDSVDEILRLVPSLEITHKVVGSI